MTIATLSTEEVAGMFGWKPGTFLKKYASLVAERGFPTRLPGGRFFAPAIERWMAETSGMAPAEPVDPLAAQREFLEGYYAGRAA